MEKVKKILKIIGKAIYGLVILVLFVIAALVAFTAFDLPSSAKFYTVKSGSMEPNISVGSLVVSKPMDSYSQDDVITFIDPRDNAQTITHRVIEVKEYPDVTKYITKGDANDAEDREEVSKSKIVGKVILDIPYLGYPTSFAKTQLGFTLLIIIPATLLIYSEGVTIFKEIKKIVQKRKEKDAEKV